MDLSVSVGGVLSGEVMGVLEAVVGRAPPQSRCMKMKRRKISSLDTIVKEALDTKAMIEDFEFLRMILLSLQ